MAHDENCECCNGGMAAFYEKLEKNIKEFGHSVIGTATGSDDNIPMSYTIGLSDDGIAPELIVFGLPPKIAVALLNDAAKLFKNGQLPLDTPIEEIANLPIIFKAVSPQVAAEYILQANSRAGREIPAIQMVLPDTTGLFPWDVGYDEDMAKTQLTLYFVH